MSHVPLPIRVAVGLVVTAVEQARKLPEQLADLPVTAASRAVQASMRVQQRVTELAIKGDQVFSLFRPVQETPAWARFDEDDEPQQSGAEATAGTADGFSKAHDHAAVVPGSGAGHGTAVRETGEVDEADVARALTSPRSATTGARPGDASLAPSVLPEYNELSLAQLRGKLRALSLPQLTELLEYEHVHQNRPAFVTLLSNRISTVRSQTTESQ
ncbi:MAG: lipid droplet-associated protein [Actinomycetota bacterium]|nr:lipid droplet-associated protein [Actinomycetota bacterium]